MDHSEFTQQLNLWGANRTPFLFVIDFEMKNPFVCRLSDAASENIAYRFPELTNVDPSSASSRIDLKKYPLSYDDYKKKFDQVYQHLAYGDSFLTNLTIRTEIQTGLSLKDLFNIARARYKILFKDQFLVFSPETFIRIQDNKIFTYPMKGTMDAALPDADVILLNSEKELAEHTTIVDLLRNDLSQVAENVTVNRFRFLDKVKTQNKDLWQVSSEISGDLIESFRTSLGDLLVKLLPAGSVSGAPKVKTVGIIQRAEEISRGFYTGVFGYFDGRNLDSGVMIRFIEKDQGKYFYRSGGGITTQSVASSEYQEAIDKIYVPID